MRSIRDCCVPRSPPRSSGAAAPSASTPQPSRCTTAGCDSATARGSVGAGAVVVATGAAAGSLEGVGESVPLAAGEGADHAVARTGGAGAAHPRHPMAADLRGPPRGRPVRDRRDLGGARLGHDGHRRRGARDAARGRRARPRRSPSSCSTSSRPGFGRARPDNLPAIGPAASTACGGRPATTAAGCCWRPPRPSCSAARCAASPPDPLLAPFDPARLWSLVR